MIVVDQIAGAVRCLPVTPEGQAQAVPAHAGELGHVVVDHLLAIEVEIARGAIIGGGGQHVVRAEEGDFLPVTGPANDAVLVQVDGLRLRREQQGKNHGRTSRIRLCRGLRPPETGTYPRMPPSGLTCSAMPGPATKRFRVGCLPAVSTPGAELIDTRETWVAPRFATTRTARLPSSVRRSS